MSHPTDETPESTGAEAPEDSPADTSLGPTSLFEVEESTPDGGPLATEESLDEEFLEPESLTPSTRTAAAEPAPKAPESRASVSVPGSGPSGPAATLLDDDEPPPELVWYVLKVQSGREDTIRD